MSGFKLLAIRPLKDCDDRFLKNLNAGVIYKFYNDFEFSLDKNEKDVISILNNSTIPDNLYGENISVSAIVGKNGSGKSSIIELFTAMIFNLSVKLDLIDIKIFKKNHKLNSYDIKRIDDEILNFNKLNCEIFYKIKNTIYSISKKRNYVYLNVFNATSNNFLFSQSSSNSFDISENISTQNKVEFLRHSFFYSIGANYSLFGLNTNENGIWLKSLFHKNDGYQTPIVLNPMRTDGIIDINRLTYLSKSRLLFNVFRKLRDGQTEQNSLRNLVNDKIVNRLILNLDFDKFTIIDAENAKKDIDFDYVIDINSQSIYLEFTKKLKKKYFSLLIKSFFPEIIEIKTFNSIINKLTIEYILKKTETIIRKYPEFDNYSRRVFRVDVKEETIKECFNILSHNFTHSTFKLRQAINFLVLDLYKFDKNINRNFLLSTDKQDGISDIVNENITKWRVDKEKSILDSFNKNPEEIDLESYLEDNYNKYFLINYLPPSFFEIDFEFKDKGFFKDLSSGEKQMVYSINSIIYHLINLKSINTEERITYNNFNIFLDEIELCFHPEFQRKFLFDLIKSIKTMNFNIEGINILFLTHSPFILSDIPTQNILKLEDGNICTNDTTENTFGANIHDLLANDFFLKDGFMGEFAKSEINKVIDSLNYKCLVNTRDEKQNLIDSDDEHIEMLKTELAIINEKLEKLEKPRKKYNKEYSKSVINIIGEPLLKYKLDELYYSAHPEMQDKDLAKKQIMDLAKRSGLEIKFDEQ
jgi:ABC-type multidrug transport system ATPase subunit